MRISAIKDTKIYDKIVFLRVDFNLPIENKKVSRAEDYRIRAVLPTIEYLLKNNNKIVLVSHLGRPNGKWNKDYSLKLLVKYLKGLLGKDIIWADGDMRDKRAYGRLYERIREKKEEKLFLLENIRFYPEEEKNNKNFAKKLASLADIFVNDAFSVCHRNNASVVGITKFLPSFAGLSLIKEVRVLDGVIKSPVHPLSVIIGGLKAETKIKVIGNFLPRANFLMLGGILANTILSVQGIVIGKSIINSAIIPVIKKMRVSDIKFHIPVDVVVSMDMEGKSGSRIAAVGNINKNEIILDIGPDTVLMFREIIRKSKMIIWNGPVGKADTEAFSAGTRAIANAINASGAYSIIGGGDTIAILHKMRLLGKFTHISTGGGAMLEYLAGNKLPGIEALRSEI